MLQKSKKQLKIKNENYICQVPHLRNSVVYDYNFWCTWVKLWYLQVLWKGKKQLKIKNENYIHHVPYLRNGIEYDHDFWYSCLKWWYLQVFISFFGVVSGVKGQKMGQNSKKVCHVLYLRKHTSYDFYLWYTYIKW